MLGLVVLAALAAPYSMSTAVANHSAPQPAEATEHTQIQAQLYVRGLSETALLRHLELRSPEYAITVGEGFNVNASAARATTIILVRPRNEGFALTVILSDGRAYDRSIQVSGEQAPRSVASALANLLAAIAEERVLADRNQVDAAVEFAADNNDTQSEQNPEQAHEGPTAGSTTAPADPQSQHRWSIGPHLHPVALLSANSKAKKPFAGAGLGLGVLARTPADFRIGADLRGLWRRLDGVTLQRIRVGLLAGYELHHRRLNLSADALVTVEPWQLRADGKRLEISDPSKNQASRAPASVALGFGLRLSPSIDLPLPALGTNFRLRLGAFLETTYSGVAVSGLRAVDLGPAGEDPLFRVGGLEIALGALISLRFDLQQHSPS